MWVCLKIGYIPNYSHFIGIMIINHWVQSSMMIDSNVNGDRSTVIH